ncbi:MAG: adenosine deaminase family protein [Candidatus Heimdallarchaeota archaeon]|nr:adenosine deaminase family protein [Candidatus Heimdallarchaeota archaeon]
MDSAIQNLKKIELHRHFEGCITPIIFHNLVKKNHPDSIYTDFNKIKELYSFQDFMSFLEAFRVVVNHITEYDDFRILADGIAQDLIRENIVYTEFLFSPEPFIDMGLDSGTILRSIMEVFESHDCKTGLVIDLVRQAGYDSMMNCLKEIIELRKNDSELKNWIKGISIGGNELDHPGKLFVDHFDLARENGLKLVAHAGEWDGNHSVWDAIDLLGVERVGHGIASVHDDKLIATLIERGINLDISIKSNYFTGISDVGNHPVKELYKKGCRISLNTDDPGFFATDLNEEYEKFLDLGFELSDLRSIVKNTLEASFLTQKEKDEISSNL